MAQKATHDETDASGPDVAEDPELDQLLDGTRVHIALKPTNYAQTCWINSTKAPLRRRGNPQKPPRRQLKTTKTLIWRKRLHAIWPQEWTIYWQRWARPRDRRPWSRI
jgi:hypothetical protein